MVLTERSSEAIRSPDPTGAVGVVCDHVASSATLVERGIDELSGGARNR
jgi:hypothetical protein